MLEMTHANSSPSSPSGLLRPQFSDDNVPSILNALEVQDFSGGRLVLEGAQSLQCSLQFRGVLS